MRVSDKKRGFTMIEVVLVLAISMSLFVAVVGYMSVAVSNSRYVDAVNDIVGYLRGVYTNVLNVENVRVGTEGSSVYCTITSMRSSNGAIIQNSSSDNYPGRSGCAVYGKLVTFGENNQNLIRMYDVIGTVYDSNFSINESIISDDEVLSALSTVGANVVTVKSSTGSCKITYAGQYEYHEPLWLAQLQKPDGAVFKGAFLVVRSPISGTVHTYHYNDPNGTLEVQQFIENSVSTDAACTTPFIAGNYDSNVLVEKGIQDRRFAAEDVTLCVATEDDIVHGDARRGITIHADGQNSSAVELLALDSEDNPCR